MKLGTFRLGTYYIGDNAGKEKALLMLVWALLDPVIPSSDTALWKSNHYAEGLMV